jgi:hypothetical protein
MSGRISVFVALQLLGFLVRQWNYPLIGDILSNELDREAPLCNSDSRLLVVCFVCFPRLELIVVLLYHRSRNCIEFWKSQLVEYVKSTCPASGCSCWSKNDLSLRHCCPKWQQRPLLLGLNFTHGGVNGVEDMFVEDKGGYLPIG